mgnify:CR=1 FL=1
MEMLLALIGLAALIGGGAAAGAYVARNWDRLIYGPPIPQSPAGPRGLIICEVHQAERFIRICADRQTAYRLRVYGRLQPDYFDSRTGDKYWFLFVPALVDFDQVLANVWDLAQGMTPAQMVINSRSNGRQVIVRGRR